MKLLTKSGDIFDRVISGLAAGSGVCLIFIMLSICAQVALRQFLNFIIPGVIEVNEYILLYLAFLGAAWLLKGDGHVRMDLVVGRLNPKAQAVVSIITSVLGAIICLALVWSSGLTTWDQFQQGSLQPKQLNIPTALLIAIIPVGSFLLFIEFLRKTYRYSSSLRQVAE